MTSMPPPARPPGPPDRWFGIPLLRAMADDYLGFVTSLQRRYGDLTFTRMGGERMVDVFDPELARQVLVDHADDVIRWERGMEIFSQAFGNSVLVTEGDTWRRQRRMLHPAFTPRHVGGLAGLMATAAGRALDDALPRGDGALVDIEALMTRLTMDVIFRALFGQAADRNEAEAAAWAIQALSRRAFREMFWPLTLPDWLPLPGKAQKRRALRVLHGTVAAQIDGRRCRGAPPEGDLLGLLLAAQDESASGPTKQEIHDQCLVVFQAGHETTATALAWWSRLVAEHPDVSARLCAEVDEVLGDRTPGSEDIPRLVFLNATLHEAMRLYPPVAALMGRRALRPMTLGDWTLPSGTLLRLTPWVIHRDPRWFPDPDAFRPERFLPGAAAPRKGSYMPFGAGPRVCLGQHFALLEMGIVAAMLLQRCTLVVPTGEPRPEPQLQVTLRPRGGIRLFLQPRYPRKAVPEFTCSSYQPGANYICSARIKGERTFDRGK